MRKLGFFAAAAAGVIIACSGGGGSTGGGGGGSAGTVDQFVSQYCEVFAGCCTKLGKQYSASKCTALTGAQTGSVNYDAAKGQACLDAARAASSNPSFCDTGSLNPGDEDKCKNVATKPGGGAAPGAQCTEDSECAPATDGEVGCESNFSGNTITRICQVHIRGKAGDACGGYKDGDNVSVSSSFSTDAGVQDHVTLCYTDDKLSCDSLTKKCVVMAEIGADCGSGSVSTQFACVKGATCDFNAKKCIARKQVGEDCTATSGISTSGLCADKLYCDKASNKCAATLNSGDACTSNEQCGISSCTNGKCGASLGGAILGAFFCQ